MAAESSPRRLADFWNRRAAGYDARMARVESKRLATSRRWVCERARGRVLDVCIGTGLDLPLLPEDATITGLDLSANMLAETRRRAETLGREVALVEGDAMALPFAEGAFDTVLCTFALCSVPDPLRALTQMRRVLAGDGVLLLADHIRSDNPLIRLSQHALELVSIPLEGEHYTRRPATLLPRAGFEIRERGRHSAGIVEHVEAVRA